MTSGPGSGFRSALTWDFVVSEGGLELSVILYGVVLVSPETSLLPAVFCLAPNLVVRPHPQLSGTVRDHVVTKDAWSVPIAVRMVVVLRGVDGGTG